jgi:hypothetical protein
VVFSNPAEGKDDEFNEWYDNVDIPDLLAIPGMLAAHRYDLRDSAMYHAEGGRPPEQRYLVIYEMEGDVEAIMGKVREAVAEGKIVMSDSLDMSSWRLSFWTPRAPDATAAVAG